MQLEKEHRLGFSIIEIFLTSPHKQINVLKRVKVVGEKPLEWSQNTIQ